MYVGKHNIIYGKQLDSLKSSEMNKLNKSLSLNLFRIWGNSFYNDHKRNSEPSPYIQPSPTHLTYDYLNPM
jgi:hypothetical protein